MKKTIYLSLVFTLFLATAYALTNSNNQSEDPLKGKLDVDTTYSPNHQPETGDELAMVFISSPNCGYCSNFPDLPNHVERAKVKLEKIAKENDMGFAVIGVAIGWSAEEGIDHLNNFGKFDEVMAGRNWFNSGAREFIHNEVPSDSKGSVPEIVLVGREVIYDKSQEDNYRYEVNNQYEIGRFGGLDEIEKLALEEDDITIQKEKNE